VVAPPEMGQALEEIRRESDVRRKQEAGDTLGVDPELDEFMVPSLLKPSISVLLFSFSLSSPYKKDDDTIIFDSSFYFHILACVGHIL